MERHEELTKLTDDEIIARINAAAPNVIVGVDFYFDEMTRRSTKRAEDRAFRLEIAVLVLTVVSVVTGILAIVD